MNFLTQPLKIGSLKLANRIFYAPLAGCSDFPFRKMSAKYQPGLMYCEMVKMDALVRYDPGTLHLLDFSPDMHPIGAQLCGSKVHLAGKSAKIIEELGFDSIDLNCGCPVDKITKDGSGSGLLKNPELIGEIISTIVAAVKIPVTVKIRIGWDETSINAPEIVKIAERAGAKMICVHGRTRQQGYRGPADWQKIKACKEAANEIIVIANGDIIDGQSAEEVIKQTGCDAVLVARGTLGQPWVVEDIKRHLLREPKIERTLEDYRQALYEHFLITKAYQNDRRVCIDMRRVGCWYLKKSSGTRQFRELISRAQSLYEIEDLIKHFPLGEMISEEPVNESDSNCC